MSRIITGLAAGRRLQPVKGDQTRPTTDRVKEALFSRLESWDMLHGKHVLDLFAGSGALGLESASRGASHVTFVEKSPVAYQALSTNISTLKTALQATLTSHRMSAKTFLEKASPTGFDVIFVDPPYDFEDHALEQILYQLGAQVNDDGVVIVERGKRSPEPNWPAPWEPLKPRSYGETTLYFAERPATNSVV